VGKVLHAEEILKDGRYIIKDIEDIIQNAMDHERLSVYYQPIYSVQEGRFASAEALLRLDDEEYGHISPELFIPVAEKNGVIHRIGTMVLEEVCRFIASDEFKELGLDYIEVNLSVTQCMRSNLAKEILQMFEKYHVRPEQINLEITETAAANSQNMMTENVRVLAEAGVPFSLDDYGTGYSNICRVTSLPLEIVKLDKSFTELEENPKLEVVVRNTVKMVKEMNMKIVVEGIETEEMAKKFSDLQCEYIQGFYYSKPLPRDEFVSFLRQAKSN
jgi:EAL domain-containing protein (putative c-di-GMP-specific phosphodiesterase class I)